MKVLQLGKAYPPVNMGGVELVIKFITEGLGNKGITCDALGVNDSYKCVIENLTMYSTVYREKLLIKKFSTLFSLHLISRLSKIASTYNIIHIHHPDPMSALALFIVNPKCKVVLHWHSDIIKQKLSYVLYRPIEKWLLKRSDLIICTSAKYLEESKVLKPFIAKSKVIPIGVESMDTKENDKLADEIKKKSKGKFIALSIGRFNYYKGFNYLIDAFKLLDSNYLLYIIGNGEEFVKIEQQIKNANLSDRVVLLGFKEDIIKNAYLKACDVFILPSIYKSEAYGIVQIEAMAFGKPVISTRIPGSGVDWVNQDGESGFTVPIKNHISIASKIKLLKEDPKLYAKIANGSLNRYQTRFTIQIMIDSLIKEYLLL